MIIPQKKFTGNAIWVLIAGVLLYIFSWFLPVHEEVHNGYEAYTSLYKSIFLLSFNGSDGVMNNIISVLAALSPHTNYVAIITILILLFAAPGVSISMLRILRNTLIVCFVINLVWLYYFNTELGSLLIGYYLWIISFMLIFIAAHLYTKPQRQVTQHSV